MCIYINNTSNFMDLVVCPNPVGFQLSQWDTQHVVLDAAFCSWDASVAVLARLLVVAQCGLSWRAALACAPAASVAMEERTLVTVHLAVQRADIDFSTGIRRLVNALLSQNRTATDAQICLQLRQMLGDTYPVEAALLVARTRPSAVAPPTAWGKPPSARRSKSAPQAYPVGIHPRAAFTAAQRAVSIEVRCLSQIY